MRYGARSQNISALVYAVAYKELIKEKQRLDEKPIVYSTFEQKQLMAIIAALGAGQIEKADLLKRRFQQEWQFTWPIFRIKCLLFARFCSNKIKIIKRGLTSRQPAPSGKVASPFGV